MRPHSPRSRAPDRGATDLAKHLVRSVDRPFDPVAVTRHPIDERQQGLSPDES
ncbi:hypothetical protein DB32_000526 [Sandaracinus amylolyticus]|uniref:Uncharacterized protein n=1 Tax=Sandaracinus amylolyticus TaxID=927083 RepID=A0A0F6VZF2_9BACT|nr:hypothetical protein DB32_000526 [Sandaracinus amylolyticus]